MRKNLAVVILSGLIIVLLSSCSINALRPFPYGIWENTELGLVLDINPKVEPRLSTSDFRGTYLEDGERIDIYIRFSVIDGSFWILRASDWTDTRLPPTSVPRLFDGQYRLRDDQLRYTLTSSSQEMTGITETIIFERIHEYEVPG